MIFTGYLIIYNIFQISVAGDIRFYGLLKTIGTTPRQRIIRQAGTSTLSDRHSGRTVAGRRHRRCSGTCCLALHPVGCGHHHHQHLACDLPWFHAVCPVDGAFVLLQARKNGSQGLSGRNATKYTDVMQTKKNSDILVVQAPSDGLCQSGRTRKRRCWWWCLALSVTLFNALCAFVGGFSMEKYVSSMTCADFIVSTPASVSTRQMNSSRQNRSRRSQQRPVFPARDMLCEKAYLWMTEDALRQDYARYESAQEPHGAPGQYGDGRYQNRGSG